MRAFYRDAVRQRRRLHVFLRRRVHRGRDHAAAREVAGVAAVDRQATHRLPRHGREFPTGRREGRGEEGQGAGEPDGDVVLRRHRPRRARDASRARRGRRCSSIRLRDILREELGGTYGVSVGFGNSAPLKGYGADDRVSSAARPTTSTSCMKAVLEGDRAAEARGAVGRRRAEGEGAGAPRPRDHGAAELVLARARCRPCTCSAGTPAGIARRDERTNALTGRCYTRRSRSISRWTATRW